MKKFKMQNAKFKIIIIFIFEFLIFNFTFAGVASAELTIKANHDHIKIDFFYHGSKVSVSGEAASGSDLIIKIASPDGHETLKQKGKAAGFLWMNLGTLKFEHTPNLYFIHSTRKPEDILSQEEINRYVIGYPALGRHIEIAPVLNDEERAKWFDEFMRYKEASRLYKVSSGQIKTATAGKTQKYYLQIDWPYQSPPGEYIVTVYVVKDKKVVEKAETAVKVEQVGIIKLLSDMAKNKGALYGIISIVIALGAGFGVGMIFRKGGGAH